MAAITDPCPSAALIDPTCRDELGFEGSACSQAVFQVAGKRPMTVEELQKALGQNLGHVTLDARHLDTTGLDLAAGG